MNDTPGNPGSLIRIRSDYVGAGFYLVSPDDDSSVVVNTDYGIQSVGLDSHEHWQADFGERCLGLCYRRDGMIVAHTLHAVFQVQADGMVHHVNPTLNEIAHAPVPFEEGVLVITLSHVYALDAGGKAKWSYAFKEALGASVRATLVLNAFSVPDGVIIGAVDYNSGLGRVLHLDPGGSLLWASDVNPMTYLFPVGEDGFVYSVSGYGKFESHLTGIDGNIRLSLDYGGAGAGLDDGRLAMLVGNNESPTWDDWEFRLLGADGQEIHAEKARGHFGFGPVPAPDRHLYMVGYFKPFDPSATRLDYTSLTPLPKFLTFDHLLGVRAQPHQYRVFYYRVPVDPDSAGAGELELLHEDSDSIAFGPPLAGNQHVFFTHNRDILAVPLSPESS